MEFLFHEIQFSWNPAFMESCFYGILLLWNPVFMRGRFMAPSPDMPFIFFLVRKHFCAFLTITELIDA